MTTSINDYVDVAARLRELGCVEPTGLAILPANLDSAESYSELRNVSEAATVRTLFRNEELPFQDIHGERPKLPYIKNNSFEWVAPTIFVAASLWSENPNAVSVALSVIANYATDVFKGVTGKKTVKLDIVVESKKTKTTSTTTKKISYEGASRWNQGSHSGGRGCSK